MSRWLQSDAALRLFSLIIAVVMWLYISDRGFSLPGGDLYSVKIKDVKVEVKYNQEQYALSGFDKKVDVTLTGNKYILENLPLAAYQVFVDVRHLGTGLHRNIPVQIRGLPSDVRAELDPAQVDIELERKGQLEVPVKVDLLGKVHEGYQAGIPVVTPGKVVVRGPESLLKQITSVRAPVYLGEATQPFDKKVKVQVYTKEGPVGQVTAYPDTVNVQVPVQNPSKEVPLKIDIREGPPAGYAVDMIRLTKDTVRVYAPDSVLSHLQVYEGPHLDLSHVTKDWTVRLPIPLRDGVSRVDPQDVEIYVKIVKAKSISLNNIPFQLIGMMDRRKVSVIYPKNQKLSLVLSGSSRQLDPLTEKNIGAFVDVSNLPIGTHRLPIELVLPSHVGVVSKNHDKVTVRVSL